MKKKTSTDRLYISRISVHLNSSFEMSLRVILSKWKFYWKKRERKFYFSLVVSRRPQSDGILSVRKYFKTLRRRRVNIFSEVNIQNMQKYNFALFATEFEIKKICQCDVTFWIHKSTYRTGFNICEGVARNKRPLNVKLRLSVSMCEEPIWVHFSSFMELLNAPNSWFIRHSHMRRFKPATVSSKNS